MRFLKSSVIGGILLAIFIGSCSLQAQEETKVRENFITLDVREKPFDEIIEGIREQTGQNIIYDNEVKEIRVTIKLVNVHWKTMLDVIAKKYNCLVEEVGVGPIIKISKPPTVTMEFEGADIRDVINQIATIANRNIVIAQTVKGAISLRLKNVPWQDALDVIIKTRGYVLVSEKEGRILRVVPRKAIQEQLETEIFRLRFLRPKSRYVAKMTSPFFKLEGEQAALKGAQGVKVSNFSLFNALTAVKSKKGKITYDGESNTLIVTDTKPKIDKMGDIIKTLDREPQQIYIDVKFIITNNSDIFDFGIDTGSNTAPRISQTFGSMETRFPFTLGRGGFEDEIAWATDADLEEGLPTQSSLPADPVLNPGRLDFSGTSFALRLFKEDRKSKIVQAPKIITLDHHEATIFVGETVSFPETEIIQNDNGSTSVQLKEAPNSPAKQGFQILVIPHIIQNTNKIRLTVIPSNDILTGSNEINFNTFTSGDASIQLPASQQQTVVTHMILESGQTAVLGGLTEINQSETVKKLPLLGDIPFLGYFFKQKTVNKTKEDLFIFVTPRIVRSADDTEEKIAAGLKQEKELQQSQYKNIWQESDPFATGNSN